MSQAIITRLGEVWKRLGDGSTKTKMTDGTNDLSINADGTINAQLTGSNARQHKEIDLIWGVDIPAGASANVELNVSDFTGTKFAIFFGGMAGTFDVQSNTRMLNGGGFHTEIVLQADGGALGRGAIRILEEKVPFYATSSIALNSSISIKNTSLVDFVGARIRLVMV